MKLKDYLKTLIPETLAVLNESGFDFRVVRKETSGLWMYVQEQTGDPKTHEKMKQFLALLGFNRSQHEPKYAFLTYVHLNNDFRVDFVFDADQVEKHVELIAKHEIDQMSTREERIRLLEVMYIAALEDR
jgi:hypothetical protein